MKRIMTVFLSALIVLCSLTCVFIAPVSAAPNLWSGISANDWLTRQVSTKVDDPLTLKERKLTEVYPEKFTYGGGSFSLEGASGKYNYVKLPALAKNKEFTLSFNYSATTSSGTPTMYKVILMPESAFTNAVTWNGYGAMLSGRSFLGAYDLFVNKPLASNELDGTVSYTFNTKTQTQYYLYLEFNNVDTITYSKFKLVDPADTTPDEEEEENPADVWTNIVENDFRTRHVHTKYDDGRTIPEKSVAENYPGDFVYNSDSNEFTLKNAHGRHHFIKMPILTKNKDYSLSVKYTVNAGDKTNSMLYKVLLVPKSAFTSEYCWNGFGEIFADRSWIDIQNVIIRKSIVGETSGVISYDFNTGKHNDYYLFVMFNDIETLTYTDFELIDPDLVVEEPEDPPVVPDEPDEEFEVKPEDAADLWTEYSLNDWYTRHLDGSATYEDGRDIPEKTVTERYGSDFTYNKETKSFKLKNAAGRHYYVKLPTLQTAKNYSLSFDYLTTLNAGKDGSFYKAILVPKAKFSSEFCWQNTTGEIYADRKFVDIQDIVGGKDDGLAPGGIVLTEENRKGNITYNFNSGSYTEYYLFLMFNNVKTVTYYNLELIDPALKDDYQGNPLNYGSVSPIKVPEGAKAGDVIEFTATPLKGNTFVGWYDDFGTLLSEEKTFAYTLKADLLPPTPVFKEGAVKVENASLEDSATGLLAYYNKDNNFEKTIIDSNYDVEYIGTPSWSVNIQAHTGHARTGEKSIKIQTQYAYSGRHFEGLEKNTDYAISFWAYIESGSGISLNAMVLPKGVKPYKENAKGELADYPVKEAMGYSQKAATATSSWQEVVVRFNSGDNTDVTVWFLSRGANSDKCWVDDIAIFKPVSLDVVGELGGSVTFTDSGLIAKDTKVTVTATPDKGNNFKHWLDGNGMVVSTEAKYTFNVEEDTYLKAVFGGYNKPARELFALRGDDGTFENGAISGIYAADEEYPDSLGHCKTTISNAEAYEGEKSLQITSYYRNTIIPLTGLNKNTDYKFSYYVKYPYNGERDDWNQINSMMIVGADDINGSTAKKVFAEANSYLAGDAGWYKVELYFNSGDNTAANFIIRYAGEPKLAPNVYMDNITLYEYYSSAELANGSMTNTIAPWLGDGEIENNTLKLSGKDTTAYQILGLDAHSRYTVKFRAKGNVFAAFSDVSAKVPNIYNAISSKSYVQANSSAFKNYSVEVYTGVHKGVALMFASLGGDVFVDDVTVTKELSAIGGVIENVDFESDRFALTHTNPTYYEIYTAKSANDENVHSGKKSLHFKYNSKSAVEAILDEAYLSYGVAYNHNYMLSLYYKYDTDTKESVINLEPNYRASYYNGDYGDYSGETGYKHPTTKGEWKQLAFVFTAGDFGVLKAAIYNIVGKTDADFYVDDIVITVASDLVVDEKAETAYTTDYYNMFTNPSFEKGLADTNWLAMPKTMQIVRNKSLADTADSFLKVSEGTKYILPITLTPSEVYYFGTSIRSFNGGKGRIYLATLVEPTTLYFTDLENNPKSVVEADSDEWKHEGFGFRASPTGATYLVVECTEGSIGIDTVSLTLKIHANSADYNRYYPHIPFDYDNIPAEMIVYNGGLDVNPEGISPSTGDSIKVVSIIFVTCLAAAATMIFTKKRKDETDA